MALTHYERAAQPIRGFYVRAIDPVAMTFQPTGVVGTGADETVHSIDVAIHDESGKRYSRENPMPTYVVDAETGTPKPNYATHELLASGASHSFLIPVANTKTFSLKGFTARASGKIFAILEIGDGATEEAFTPAGIAYNSVATPHADWMPPSGVYIPIVGTANTTNAKITVTNLDKDDFDVFINVFGVEYDTPA